jgi:hypothetical protein
MDIDEQKMRLNQASRLYERGEYFRSLNVLKSLDPEIGKDKYVRFLMALCLTALERGDEAWDICETLSGEFEDSRVECLMDRIALHRTGLDGEGVTAANETGEGAETAPSRPGPDAPASPGPPPRANEESADHKTIDCPFCSKELPAAALKCEHCGEDLYD